MAVMGDDADDELMTKQKEANKPIWMDGISATVAFVLYKIYCRHIFRLTCAAVLACRTRIVRYYYCAVSILRPLARTALANERTPVQDKDSISLAYF
jgi:hypothetical protein